MLEITFSFSFQSRAFTMTAGERNSLLQISEPTTTEGGGRTVGRNLIEVSVMFLCNY